MSADDIAAEDGLIRAVRLLGRPWTLLIIASLLDHPKRFNEIVSALPGISTNLLTERLRVLLDHGIITRTPTQSSSMYALTEQGRALRPILTELARWGRTLPSRPST